MRKLLIIVLASFCFLGRAFADEGMWLLPFLSKMNIGDMKAQGLKLSAEDIYSINNSSLKDAIIIFGNGCTGEIVSDKGLILTNHHCGYGAIQQHSTVDHDYLKNGFWAASMNEEIPTPGLTATFIRSIVDITDEVMSGLNDKMTEDERMGVISVAISEIRDAAKAKNPGKHILIKDFFGENQYLMFVTDIYNDIRMVGAPPSSIGKFGGDTDNWMWPRHTGDFSVFRVYSDASGESAEYSAENVPYKPLKHLNISLKGIEPGDFTMIMGFPGSTNRYMSSYEIDQVLEQDNPIRIEVRGLRQQLMMEDMKASDRVRIQYASKYASSSNYWKNSIGMSRGLKRLKVKDEKLAIEDRFTKWVAASPDREVYAPALSLKEEAVEGRRPYLYLTQYNSEALTRGTEIINIASLGGLVESALKDSTASISAELMTELIESSNSFYKNYNMPTDKKIAKAMLELYGQRVKESDQPSFFASEIRGKFNGDYEKYVDHLYGNSIFADQAKLETFLKNPTLEELTTDPAYMAYASIRAKTKELRPNVEKYQKMFARGHRLFIAGLLAMEKDKNHYPDANFTLRLSYGQVLPYSPADAVIYDYYTTLGGVIEKEDPSNPMEFTVPVKLKELYAAKDFGRYAYKGDVPVAFLSNNDITGGNSGSPVLNNKGELLGLAFDGNWEAMSGDIAFEPALQRTISVDIRYVLFIIDKFAGSKRLIDEMTIVE